MIYRFIKGRIIEWVNRDYTKKGVSVVFSKGRFDLYLEREEELGLEFWWFKEKKETLIWKLVANYKEWLETGKYTATYKVFRTQKDLGKWERDMLFYPFPKEPVESSFKVGIDRTLPLQTVPYTPIVKFYRDRTFDLFFLAENKMRVLKVQFPEEDKFPNIQVFSFWFYLSCKDVEIKFEFYTQL